MNKHEAVMTKVTSGTAVVGLSSAWWPPTLAEVSGLAGQLVPILSAAFLAAQVARFVWQWRKDARNA